MGAAARRAEHAGANLLGPANILPGTNPRLATSRDRRHSYKFRQFLPMPRMRAASPTSNKRSVRFRYVHSLDISRTLIALSRG